MCIILKVGGSVRTRLRLRAAGTGEIGCDDPEACSHQGFPEVRPLLDTLGEPWEQGHGVREACCRAGASPLHAARLCGTVDTRNASCPPSWTGGASDLLPGARASVCDPG